MALSLALTIDDLALVFEEAYEARMKWHDLGLALRVPEDALESIESRCSRPKDGLREMLKAWLRRVEPQPTWAALVKALASKLVEEGPLAKGLEEKYCRDTASSQQRGEDRYHESSLFTKLKEKLEPLCDIQDDNARESISQMCVKDYITKSIQSDASMELITEQLQILRSDGHICEHLYQQALVEASKLHSELHTTPTEAANATISKPQPLFNKDTVYHAGICSLAVCTHDAGNYQRFFKDKMMVPGHSFTEVSLSRSKQDRFLIAQQDESTIYFSFQSEPLVLEWSKQFKSFSDGITKQCMNFPTRYIVELLNKQQCIVLTGFSFGGLLACAVTASVWETPYISTDLLRQNLVCITFGQPHISMPMLDRVASQRPELVSTIHSFHCEDDPVPRLLRFLDVSWKEEERNRELMPSYPVEPFQDSTTAEILIDIGKLQQLANQAKTSTEQQDLQLLSELTSKLESVVSKLDPRGSTARQLPPRSTSYLLSALPTGLTCTQLSQEEAALQSSFMKQEDINKLSADSFTMHSMLKYIQAKLFLGYLDKDPKYSLPSAPAHSPGTLSNLKPSVRSVEICHHGNETAVVLEGENLWFCHQVTVGGHHELLPAQKATASSIQFNIPRQDGNIEIKDGKVKISLENHFFRSTTESVTPNVEEYSITTRQQQLAQLTPSNLIEMAYMCALLEQHPYSASEPSSRKFEIIKSFLESVVHVVPLESIVFAISHGSYDTAMSCYEAVKSFKPILPISSHMFEGLKYATWRMRDGISGYDVRRLEGRSRGDNVDHDSLKFRNSTLQIDSEEIVMTHYLRVLRQPQSNLSGVSVTASIKREEVKLMKVTRESKAAAIELILLNQKLMAIHERQKSDFPSVLCGQVIDRLYPISYDSQQQGCVALRSPLSILSSGRDQLCALLEGTKATSVGVTHKRRSDHNKKMLKIVNKIRTKEVDTCVNLLGAFMQQQEIAIILSDTTQGTSIAFGIKAAASVGVWALFSLDYSRVLPLLDRCKGRKLLVNIEESIDRRTDKIDENSCYAAKLQFMVQGMLKTVTCNSQYISYSFERQLMAVCTERNIDASIPLDTLFKKWDIFFKGNTLSLVHKDSRRLIAHWMKWALMIHCLREKLAKYTAIGVVGLVNSGKSKLVNTLFGIQIPVGTAEASRTTVPFLYNLDEHVEGLDVVDFPGVDDEDDTISGLADLLVTIAQIVIFVTDYRRAGSKSAKQWLDRLQREKVPVLVCLTFADKFYAEHMTEDGQHPKKETMKDKLEDQLFETRRKIGPSPSRKVQFFSFSQDRDSVLNSPDGRQRLEEVGIGSPRDVGAWLVRVFQRDFGQEELASQLEAFIGCPEPDCRLS